jgi:hypothetical protein
MLNVPAIYFPQGNQEKMLSDFFLIFDGGNI